MVTLSPVTEPTLKSFFADDNQRLCASLLPYTFKLLQECQQETIVQPLTAFLGLLVANNGETVLQIR